MLPLCHRGPHFPFKYHIKFSDLTKHFIVLFSDLYTGCPLNVPILDASRVTVQGDGLHQVAVNRQSQFRVTTQTGADADLRVRVTGKVMARGQMKGKPVCLT